jgi:molybdopterin-guanine dinucleotide biosynthesis protein A
MIHDVTAVVLAGGKSSRMGTNKAWLKLDSEPLILRTINACREVFHRVVVSVDPSAQNAVPDLPAIRDRYPDCGPLGAITTVLESGEQKIFCVACDMPFLNPSLLEYIAGDSLHDAVIPLWNDKSQVLHALYTAHLLPAFHAALQQNRLKITEALTRRRIRYVQPEEILQFDPEGLSFKNINTPSDFADSK